jgi:predicted Rossmann fold flavoprotein
LKKQEEDNPLFLCYNLMGDIMYDVIVIGAGPAGIMTAINTSKKSLKTLLIDKNQDIGKKLKLTGGGRCNITNLKNNNELINKIHNGKYLEKALDNFNAKDIVNYIKSLKIELIEEDNNRIFLRNGNINELVIALKKELKEVEMLFNTSVLEVTKEKEVITDKGIYKARNIVIATGGSSYKQTESDGSGYIFAKELGHKITDIYPSETYLVTREKHNLDGISIEATASYDKYKEEGQVLFTHFGLSGPAIMNISEKVARDIKNNNIINIDLLPKITKEELLESLNNYSSKLEIKTWLKQYLNDKLTKYILKDLEHIKIASISKINKNNIIDKIKNLSLEITKTGSIEEAIVTSGGIDINEINISTMESKLVNNIYFVGEVLDLHGPVGGYNLTIAFTTGYLAGINIK